MTIAALVIRIVEVDLAIGLAFALWFAWRGAARFDPVAGGGSLGFRLLIIPGAALLWPYLVVRLVTMRRSRMAAP